MHTTSYWKGFRNAFVLLFGVGLLVLTYFIWQADILQMFGGHVQVPQLMEPFRWLAMLSFGGSGLVIAYLFLEDSFDFDLGFHRKVSTIDT